jgi:hypothetical protein
MLPLVPVTLQDDNAHKSHRRESLIDGDLLPSEMHKQFYILAVTVFKDAFNKNITVRQTRDKILNSCGLKSPIFLYLREVPLDRLMAQ